MFLEVGKEEIERNESTGDAVHKLKDRDRRLEKEMEEEIVWLSTVKTGPSRLIFGNNCLVFIFCIHQSDYSFTYST